MSKSPRKVNIITELFNRGVFIYNPKCSSLICPSFIEEKKLTPEQEYISKKFIKWNDRYALWDKIEENIVIYSLIALFAIMLLTFIRVLIGVFLLKPAVLMILFWLGLGIILFTISRIFSLYSWRKRNKYLSKIDW